MNEGATWCQTRFRQASAILSPHVSHTEFEFAIFVNVNPNMPFKKAHHFFAYFDSFFSAYILQLISHDGKLSMPHFGQRQ
jgi:hypothetical protein